MSGSFVDNLKKLSDQTPERVTGHVVVDQVYAHYQHEHPEFHHPDGGEAFYLKTPLYVKHEEYMQRLSKASVNGTVTRAMIENMEDLSLEVYNRAPWEFGDLRASGHPIVEEDGQIVYDRAPHVHRLSTEELAIKSHLRYLFDPHRYAYDERP